MIYPLTSEADDTDDSYNQANSMKYDENDPYGPNNPSRAIVKCGHAETEYTYQL
jgi:hypothetical protein